MIRLDLLKHHLRSQKEHQYNQQLQKEYVQQLN